MCALPIYVGDGVGLARAGHAEQRLLRQAALEPVDQLRDRLRLVASGLEGSHELEIGGMYGVVHGRRAGERTDQFSEPGKWGRDHPEQPRRRSGLHPRRLLTFAIRSEEHTSELQSLMRTTYAVFCLQKKKNRKRKNT